MFDKLLSADALEPMIEKLIQDKGGDLIEGLVTKIGFSKEQAERYVPMAIRALVPIVKAKLLGDKDGPTEVDTAALASAAQVDEGKAKSGIAQLAPQLEGMLKGQLGEGGLGEMAGNLLGGKGLGGLF